MALFAEPRRPLAEALRYGLASGLVVAVAFGMSVALGRGPNDEVASQVDDAVLVELPPAQASPQGENAAPDAPQEPTTAAPPMPERPAPQAAETATPQPVPAAVPPADADRPDAVPLESAPPRPPLTPPPPTPPPQPQPTLTEAESAPAGSPTSAAAAAEDSADARTRAAAHAITVWQQALMKRLEGARRRLGAVPRRGGIVTVGFRIDATGALLSQRVAKSSGSQALDAAALLLVRRAAPFPAPPAGSRDDELSFTIPVRFR